MKRPPDFHEYLMSTKYIEELFNNDKFVAEFEFHQ